MTQMCVTAIRPSTVETTEPSLLPVSTVPPVSSAVAVTDGQPSIIETTVPPVSLAAAVTDTQTNENWFKAYLPCMLIMQHVEKFTALMKLIKV